MKLILGLVLNLVSGMGFPYLLNFWSNVETTKEAGISNVLLLLCGLTYIISIGLLQGQPKEN